MLTWLLFWSRAYRPLANSARGSTGIRWLRRCELATLPSQPPRVDASPNRASDTSPPPDPPGLPRLEGTKPFSPSFFLRLRQYKNMRMPATAKTAMTPMTIPTTAPAERLVFPDFSTWDWLLPVRPGSGTAVTVWTLPPTVTVWTDGAVGLVPSLFGCACSSQRCPVKAVSPSKFQKEIKIISIQLVSSSALQHQTLAPQKAERSPGRSQFL